MKIRLNRNHCLLVLAGLAGVVAGRSGWRNGEGAAAQSAEVKVVSVRPAANLVTAAGREESRPVVSQEAFSSSSGDSLAVIEPVRAEPATFHGSSNFGVSGTISGRGSARKPAPSRDELAARAAQVEVEASHELKRLVGLLKLNETQQDKIFEILAVNSPSWHPALAVTGGLKNEISAVKPAAAGAGAETVAGLGATAPASIANPVTAPASAAPAVESGPETAPASASTVSDLILAELEIDQALAYESEESERISWWEEILSQVMPETVVSDGTGSSVAAAVSLTEPTLTEVASPLAPVSESVAETTPVETAPVAASEISTPKKSVTRPTTLPSE